MKKLKIAYFGTPYFSDRFLEKLLTDTTIKNLIEVKLVVTQPDKPVGKKQIITKSPVKIVAERFGIDVYDSNKPNSQSLLDRLKTVDIALLYSLFAIITKKMLALPKMGFWNTHPSLLPKYRGALPIAMPLILGDQETGVTLIKLDEKVDHGPIIAQKKLTVNPTDKKPDLEIKLTDLAFGIFKKKIIELTSLRVNELKTISQNHSNATYTHQLKKDDGFIPFSTLKKAVSKEQLTIDDNPKILKDYYQKNNLTVKPCSNETIYNLFRGLFPWPGIWTVINIKGTEKRLKITDMDFSNGKLTIKKVQLEGKKEVDFETFNKAYSIF